MKRLHRLVGSALFCCLSAWAQNTATIVGTVTDTSGAVIPGAKVAVSNPEKGFTRELSTNTTGEYTAAKLPIGNYVIVAEKKGFQKLVRSGIAWAVLGAFQNPWRDLRGTDRRGSQELSGDNCLGFS